MSIKIIWYKQYIQINPNEHENKQKNYTYYKSMKIYIKYIQMYLKYI